MNFRTLGLLGLTSVALVACGNDTATPEKAPATTTTAAPAAPNTTAPASAGALTLVGEGLRFSGTPGMIAFDTPKAGVLAAAKAALGGEPVMSTNADCPNGATEDYSFGSKLILITRGGQFVGWQSDEAGPATTSGIRAGSPRTDATASDSFQTVDSTFEQTQISVDTVSGFLNDDGTKVDMLYAGDTCLAS